MDLCRTKFITYWMRFCCSGKVNVSKGLLNVELYEIAQMFSKWHINESIYLCRTEFIFVWPTIMVLYICILLKQSVLRVLKKSHVHPFVCLFTNFSKISSLISLVFWVNLCNEKKNIRTDCKNDFFGKILALSVGCKRDPK